MSTIKLIFDCMVAPKLIRIYGQDHGEGLYKPNALEKWGDQVINSLHIIWKIGVYTSPILVGILYQKGYLTPDGAVPLTKFVTTISVVLVVSYCFKGFGRYLNNTYMNFYDTVRQANLDLTPDIKQQLSMYDFDFSSWPVEFNMREISSAAKTNIYVERPKFNGNLTQYILRLPFKVIAYLAIHSFGIRLIYPGTIGLLQVILEQSLIQGRARLVESRNGQRFKLHTIDNNDIDAMFIDQRYKHLNGNTLVICSEGNAGFYEIGIMVTPIEAGYSTLGWNHPGFGWSTGRPYPSQERNAIDAVLQFAIQKLGFKPENILLFGWSIGGYPASWAAMNYPDVRGVILDATFDDILPLALSHMPIWWESIVKVAIRQHVNLNIGEQLCQYPGPILLIRRTDDEVICLREGDLLSNRGNDLLVQLFRHRYPKLFGEQQNKILQQFLSVTQTGQDALLVRHGVEYNECYSRLQTYVSEYSKSYPSAIGDSYEEEEKTQLLLYLASKHLKDFKSTHCINLAPEMFQPPWDIEPEYVLP